MFPRNYWLVLLTYVLVQFSIVVIYPVLHVTFGLSQIDAIAYGQVTAFFIGTIIVYLLLRKNIHAEFKQSNNTAKTLFIWSVIGIILAYGAQVTAALTETYVFGIQPGSENTQQIMDMIQDAAVFLIIPAIFAPILEELIFRKIIFGSLYKKMNFFWAAIISSFIFGVIHMDLTHLLVYTGMGLVFSFLYVRTKTIVVPIIVHMGMNTFVVLAQLLIDPAELEKLEKQLGLILPLIGG